MNLFLYTDLADMPKDCGAHVSVFAGAHKDYDGDIVTYVQCIYFVSGYEINYRLSGDVRTARFEQALQLAYRRANILGLENIHAVFTLSRPIDLAYVQNACPELTIQNRDDIDVDKLMVTATTVIPFTKAVGQKA